MELLSKTLYYYMPFDGMHLNGNDRGKGRTKLLSPSRPNDVLCSSESEGTRTHGQERKRGNWMDGWMDGSRGRRRNTKDVRVLYSQRKAVKEEVWLG